MERLSECLTLITPFYYKYIYKRMFKLVIEHSDKRSVQIGEQLNPKEFYKAQCEKKHWEDDEIFPPPTKAQDGLDILIKHFLGDGWYCISTNNEQGNTEAIYEILEKYPHPRHILLEKIRRIIDEWKKKKQY